jgi:acyl carrier protein
MPSMEKVRIRRDDLPLARPYVAPRTVLEQSLTEIWRQTLSVDQVGIEDDYDELGGDSVSAAIIFTQIEDKLGVALPISTLVDAPTVARLADVIGKAKAHAGS